MRRLLVCAATLVAVAACDDNPEGLVASARDFELEMVVDPTTVGIGQDSIQELDVDIIADGNIVSGAPIGYSSSNPMVATVSSSGEVTGIRGGTAEITVTFTSEVGDLEATIPVTVRANPAASVVLAPATAALPVGDTLTLDGRVIDATGDIIYCNICDPEPDPARGVTWSSADTAVAAVSSGGTVTAKAVGTARIILRSPVDALADTSVITVTPAP